jgi:aminoglycoside phosphotransferase (APT) family kinase protein
MLSTDDLGREMFTYVDGEVPRDLAFHDDATLRAAATLIRRFHDLAAEVLSSSERATAEVVCHHDLSPCNFVFRDGVPVAIIDFDAAAPGMRVADVAYAAWLWLDIGSPDVDAAEQRRRLLVFLQAYGPIDVAVVVDAMLERQASLAREGEQAVGAAMAEWAAACLGWTQTHRAVLLGRGPER